MQRSFLIIVVFLLALSACVPQAESTQVSEEQSVSVVKESPTVASQPTEIRGTTTPLPSATSTALPTQTPTISPADMTPAEIAALPVEQQKEFIEARYEGGNVYETIVLSDEKLIFYDGSSWKELDALVGFNGEVIPWGEVYRLNDQNDVAELKEIFKQDSDKLSVLNSIQKNTPEVSFLQFYPDNNTWSFQDDIEKPAYGTYGLEGYIVIKSNNVIFVIRTKTNPYRSLVIFQEGKSGSFSTRQIKDIGLENGIIGLSPRKYFENGSDGRSIFYQNGLTDEETKNLVGGDDLIDTEEFINKLRENKTPIFDVTTNF